MQENKQSRRKISTIPFENNKQIKLSFKMNNKINVRFNFDIVGLS